MAAPNVLPFTHEPGELLDELARREEQRLRSLARPYARSVPIASDIDPDSCLRRQVLEIVAWADKPLPGPGLQARFEIGSLHEREALIRLRGLGFDLVEEQVPFELKHRRTGEPCLRGRLDAKIRWHAQKIAVEVKTLLPAVYDRVDGLEDLGRFWWLRKYQSQLQAYLIGYDDAPGWGFFYITDCLGHWKPIQLDLDLDLAERIWSFAEAIVDGVHAHREQDGALPPMSDDPTECARCPFFGRRCNPDIVEQGAAFLNDPELEADIVRWLELKPGRSEYEALDKRVKAGLKTALPTRPLACGIVGRFAVTIKDKPVRAEATPRPARTDRVVTIEELGAPEKGGDA